QHLVLRIAAVLVDPRGRLAVALHEHGQAVQVAARRLGGVVVTAARAGLRRAVDEDLSIAQRLAVAAREERAHGTVPAHEDAVEARRHGVGLGPRQQLVGILWRRRYVRVGEHAGTIGRPPPRGRAEGRDVPRVRRALLRVGSRREPAYSGAVSARRFTMSRY